MVIQITQRGFPEVAHLQHLHSVELEGIIMHIPHVKQKKAEKIEDLERRLFLHIDQLVGLTLFSTFLTLPIHTLRFTLVM